ncbi:MAG: DUF2189 domain-containing protein, partial [Hyphomicrobiaceae bacterium]
MHDASEDKQNGVYPTNGQAFDVAHLTLSDVSDIVGRGIADLKAAPVVSVAIASIYTVGGWLLAALLLVLDLPYLVYPLAMGFALIAPFVAVAFYDVSRRLERGEAAAIAAVWSSVREATRRDVRWMALITGFAFFIWLDIAAMITLTFFGAKALDFKSLAEAILTTDTGWLFLFVGHAAGAIIALLTFSISVVSFQMLFDRNVDVMTAMATSVRLLKRNPVAMGTWCIVIALSLGL